MEPTQTTTKCYAQWYQAAANIVIDFTQGTWNFDSCVVILRGLPGSGKSSFANILTSEFRHEFSLPGTQYQRYTCVCTKNSYEIEQGEEAFFTQYLIASLQVADVVVVDADNIFMKDLNRIQATAFHFWENRGLQGKIYTVNFACRNEAHAVNLNHRASHPVPDEAIHERYNAFTELEREMMDLSDCFTIDSDI